jgi:hypothetical protein
VQPLGYARLEELHMSNEISKRVGVVLGGAVVLLNGCYVAPLGPDGRPYPQQPTTVIVQAPPSGSGGSAPQLFTARLYPANDVAARTGIIAGSVTSAQDGKGVFSIPYNGETLTGEATRTTVGNAHTGIANASSPRGAFVRCNYRMTNATQGTGECMFSDNARFQLHLGN